MSYEIIKSIKIKEDKVFIRCSSNNVYPHDFNEFECESLTKILAEQGQDGLDLEIIKAYESGSFQRGSNKYIRALQVLRHMPGYERFNWRNGSGKEYDEICERRKTQEFEVLLKEALKIYLPKDKFVITKNYCGSKVYARRFHRSIRWKDSQDWATIFRYEQDAQSERACFSNSEDWQIERAN